MSKCILVVDDDALMRRSLCFNLEHAGYQTNNSSSAEEALALIKNDPPDLVLLDIGLPGMDGLEAIQQFKQQLNRPVIFITARRRKLDEVVGLEIGADDYITKPFDMDILLAHIKAVLRRSHPATEPALVDQLLTIGDLTINPAAHTVSVAGRFLDLSPREFDLLVAFARRPNQVLPADELLHQVWGAEYIGEPQVVYVHIRWLREKLETDPNHPERIITVRGLGYKMVPRGK
jgi:DNA-binding response OmpR family regulator